MSRVLREAPPTLEGDATGRALAGLVSAPNDMSVPDYNGTVKLDADKRRSLGVFARAAKKTLQHMRQLETQRGHFNEKDAAALEKLIALSDAVAQVHLALAGAQSSDPQNDAATALERIADASEALRDVDPDLLGQDAYREIAIRLKGMAEFLLAVPEMQARGVLGPVDIYMLQAHRRLQQLVDGGRTRESLSYAGALDTFRNDGADRAEFGRRFEQIDFDLARGKIADASALKAAMLDAVAGTSERFRQSVSRLADVRWVASEAGRHGKQADAAYAQAMNAFDVARAHLEEADYQLAAADRGTNPITTEGFDPADAQAVLHTADSLRSDAEEHLARFRELMSQGEAAASKAKQQFEIARLLSDAATALLDSIVARPQDPALTAEVERLQRAQAALRQSMTGKAAELGEHADDLREAADWTAEYAADFAAKVRELSAAASLRELEEGLGLHLDDGVERLHRAVESAFEGLKLSDRARAHLANPDGTAPEDRADVRAELTRVFEEHPAVAARLASEIAGARTRFNALRDRAGGAEFSSQEVRAINTSEHGLLSMWLSRDGLVLEALLGAELRGAAPAIARGELARWTSEVQQRYGQSVLLDPERSKLHADHWHGWLVDGQSPLSTRYYDVVSSYGEPLERVPVSLYGEHAGTQTIFNAYMFQRDGQWKAFNSIDGRVYSGDTRAEALRHLADDSELGAGTLSVYIDGDVQLFESREPDRGSMATDIGMGVAGGVGLALLAAPEPVVSKWGGGTLLAISSSYFIGKGTAALIDLVQHETVGFNVATGAAALDIASGLLVGLRGAGFLANAAKSQSFLQAQLAQIGQSAGLTAAELGTGAAGLGLAAQGLNEIYRNDDLSDDEKVDAAAEMLVATLIPILLVGGFSQIHKLARAQRRAATAKGQRAALTKVHETTLTQAQTALDTAALIKSSRARKELRRSIEDIYRRGQMAYADDIFDSQPALRAEGLAVLEKLRRSARLPETLKPPTPMPEGRAAQPIHSVEDMVGYRRTVGWSGDLVKHGADRRFPHLQAIRRGIEIVSEKRLAELDARIHDATMGSAESNGRLDQLQARRGELYRKLDEAKRVGADSEAVLGDIERLEQEWEFAQAVRSTQMRRDRALAVRTMKDIQAELMGPGGPARAKAEALVIDESVKDPDGVRDTATLFFRLTGDRLDPSKLTVKQLSTRGFADPRGELDIGKGRAKTVLHELAHFVEFENKAVYDVAQSWKIGRAVKSKGRLSFEKLSELTGDSGYRDGERALEDAFYLKYVGKEYGTNFTEVFTTGLEMMQTAETMLDLYLRDPEHF
ncbi:MAG: hypothetical protein AAFX94_02015, partial [Myxococcota bacterium]